MLATVWKKFLVKYEKHLKEFHCFYFTNPQLAQIRTKYKHFPIDNMLSFNFDTHIKKCDDFKGSLYGFNFSKFSSLGDGSTSIDMRIGILFCIYTQFLHLCI